MKLHSTTYYRGVRPHAFDAYGDTLASPQDRPPYAYALAMMQLSDPMFQRQI